MGKYGPYIILTSLLSVIPALLTQTPNHLWTFDKVDTIANIQDEITKTSVGSAAISGAGYFTTFPPTSQSAASKKYLTLRGANQKINLGSYPDCIGNISNCKDGFTLSLWLRFRNTQTPQYIFSSSENSTTKEAIGVSLLSKNRLLYFIIAFKGNLHSFSYKSESNQWNLHTFIWDGTKASVFVNGRKVDSVYKATVTLKRSNVTEFNLGGDKTSNDADFDDIKIWHRQLTGAEIEKNYLSAIEDLVLSRKCVATTSKLCISTKSRNDYYKLIASDDLFITNQRSKVVKQVKLGLQQQKCIEDLVPVTAYEIYIWSKFNDGRGRLSNKIICNTIDGVPNPPRDLKLKVISTTELSAAWKKPSPTNGLVTNYMIEISEVGSSKVIKSKTIAAPKNNFTVNGLNPGTTYKVSVSSISKVGTGNSTSDTAVLFREEMVSDIRVTDVLDKKLTITWTRKVKPNTYTPEIHRVYYRPYGEAKRYYETKATSVPLIGLKPLTFYSINVFANIRGKYVQVLNKDIVVKTKGKNECDDPVQNNCDPLANCTDTEKTFICTCQTGYFGDGKVCHRIPSYSLETHYCPAENYRNLEWPKQYGGYIAKLPCPDGVYGYATRVCTAPTLYSTARYVAPDLSRCVTKSVRELESLVIQLDDGSSAILNFCNKIIEELQSIELYGGDIKATVSYVKQILEKKLPKNSTSNVKQIGNKLTLLTSLLLDSKAIAAWIDIPEVDRSDTAKTLLMVMENAAVQIIQRINENEFEAAENNSVIKIQKTPKDAILQTYGINGTLGYSIQIPEDDPAISGLQNSPLLLTKYNNIGRFLKEPKGNLSVSPSLISATFIGKKVKFEKPVVIGAPHPEGFNVSNPSCVFWDSSSNNGAGAWSSDGCELHSTTSNYTYCNCYHLTNFAVLMTLTPAGVFNIIAGPAAYSLKIITYIGLIISIIALVIALFSFIIFRFLRSKRIICHSHLVLALLFASITFLAGIESTGNRSVCQAVAVLLEYFYLVAFCWMAVEGILLYFMLRKIFKEVKLFKKKAFHAMVWILPAIYVMALYGIFPQHYGTPQYCWLSTSGGFIWTFILPVLLVLLFNTCIMIMALYMMASRSNDKGDTVSQQTWYWLKGSFILMCILGVTWVFGLLHLDPNSIAFAYIFAILNAFQGVFIFIFHCIIDEKVRNEYIRILKCQPRAEFNEKNNSSNSRYHKISTSITSTPNTGTLRNVPSSPGSQKEFYTLEEQPFGFDNPPDSPESRYSKEVHVYQEDLSQQSSQNSTQDNFDLEKGSCSSLPNLPRSSDSVDPRDYDRAGPEEVEEDFVAPEECMMIECVPHRDSIPEEFVYEEIGRKKSKNKQRRAQSDSVPTNSVEELLKMFGGNEKESVVDVPEPEACFSQTSPHHRESLLCEQVILPESESIPWRSSIFDRVDDDHKRRESDELRLFHRAISETKDETHVDIYDSKEELNFQEDEIQELVHSELHASIDSFQYLEAQCAEEEKAEKEPVVVNIEDKRTLTVNIDNNKVLTLNIEDNNVMALNVGGPKLSRGSESSDGSKLSLVLDDDTEIFVDHNNDIALTPKIRHRSSSVGRKGSDRDKEPDSIPKINHRRSRSLGSIELLNDAELDTKIEEIEALTDSLVAQYEETLNKETDDPNEVEVNFNAKTPVTPIDLSSPNNLNLAGSPAAPRSPFKFDINVSFTFRDSTISEDSVDVPDDEIKADIEAIQECADAEYEEEPADQKEKTIDADTDIMPVNEKADIDADVVSPGEDSLGAKDAESKCLLDKINEEADNITSLPSDKECPGASLDKQEKVPADTSEVLPDDQRSGDLGDDETATDTDSGSKSDRSIDNRMSFPSKIMNDIDDIIATIPPKMEQREPSKRQRVKSKVRTRPKLSLSLSSSFDSNTDSEREVEPLSTSLRRPAKPAQAPDLELFKEVEDTIEKDQEAMKRARSPKVIDERRLSPASEPRSSPSISPTPPISPVFRCEMEIVQIQPGNSVIGSATHTLVSESEDESRI